MKDDDLRRMAETENYKKRLRTEKENAVKYANESLISDLLEPLDNFARAIESASQSKDFEAMKTGVVMVNDQMLHIPYKIAQRLYLYNHSLLHHMLLLKN